MKKLGNVIVGVDCSPCCKSALVQAARLARNSGAKLTVFHAIDPLVLADLAEVVAQKGDALREAVIRDARTSIEKMLNGVERPERFEIAIVVGVPLDEILDRTRAERADLLVLGVRGSGGHGHGAGILSTKCVRKAPCKVLLMDEAQKERFGSIVACVDFSDISREVVAQAARLAHDEETTLHALHVFDPPWHRLHYRTATPQAKPEYKREFIHILKQRLEAFVAPIAADTSQSVECHAVEGRGHGWGIIDYARQHRVGLVVLGTRSRSNLHDMLLGSTAERVLREASGSLLAIRGP